MAEALRAALIRASGVVINTDSDGLVSAILAGALARASGRPDLPVVGLYDNERLWLAPGLEVGDLLDDPEQVLYLDADVRIAGATVVSQHVVHDPRVAGLALPPPCVLLNPNYLDIARGHPYRRKYPFSTAAWIWALGAVDLPPPPGPSTPLLTGLLWAQDGGHESVAEHAFRSNCLRWALDLIEDMPLASAARALQGMAAEDRVGPYHRDRAIVARAEAAEVEMKKLMGNQAPATGWQSQQWCFAARGRTLVADPVTRHGRAQIERFLSAAAHLLGLVPPSLAPVRMAAVGRWCLHRVGQAPPDWASAFSAARTYADRIAHTQDLQPA
jgi:hypothetical protein